METYKITVVYRPGAQPDAQGVVGKVTSTAFEALGWNVNFEGNFFEITRNQKGEDGRYRVSIIPMDVILRIDVPAVPRDEEGSE